MVPLLQIGGGIKKGGILSSQKASPGQAGYINFARIKILQGYANHPCVFLLSGRGRAVPMIISVYFDSVPGQDPGVKGFYRMLSYEYDVYINKNSTGLWDLYAPKNEAHGNIDILDLWYSPAFDITYPDILVETPDSSWIKATENGLINASNYLLDTFNNAGISMSYYKPGLTIDQFNYVAVWDIGNDGNRELRGAPKNLFTYLKIIDNIYGMCVPYGDGSGVEDDIWIRTPKPGILPYSTTGVSSLGYSDWPFGECHARKVFANQIHAANDFQYNQNMYSHAIVNFAGSYINFTTSFATSHGIAMQVSPANNTISLHPLTGNSANLGMSDRLWNNIYATNSMISTSDKNQKKDISYIGQYSEYKNTKMSDDVLTKFIISLKPCIFLRIDGESGRPHHGFISQDFKKSMDESGIADHAAYIKSPKVEYIEKEIEQEREVYDEVEKKTKIITEKTKVQEEKIIEGEFDEGLRYEEVIPDITRFCQILYNQNQEQQKKIEDLENRINILENIIKQGA